MASRIFRIIFEFMLYSMFVLVTSFLVKVLFDYLFHTIHSQVFHRRSELFFGERKMKILKYGIKYLFAFLLLIMIFIIYLNMKYVPGRTQMLRQLNEWNFQQIYNKAYISGNNKGRIINTISKQNKSRQILCIRFIGRLGNMMFLFASSYGISRMKNMDLIISDKNDLLDIFHIGSNNIRIVANNNTLCEGKPFHSETQNCAFDKKLLQIKTTESFWIYGYLQSYKYFEVFSNELHSQFTFKSHIQQKANAILLNITTMHIQLKRLKQAKVTLIGVHIRRGDMVNNDYGYTVGTREYFQKAMNWFRSKYQKTVFVVCSNDIPWSKKNLEGKDIYFVEGEPREIDLAVLATCDHLISSVGSFSWWAAWLCKGTVTYYFPPAKNDSALRHHYSKDYSDYFLPQWIHF